MKNLFLILCTTVLLFASVPAYSTFFRTEIPVSHTLKIQVAGSQTGGCVPEAEAGSRTVHSSAVGQVRHRFWKKIKMRLLRYLLPEGKNDKQVLAFVMGLIGGIFGLHRFVLGYNAQGLVYALVTLFCGLLLLFGALVALLAGGGAFAVFLRPALILMGGFVFG